MLDWIKVLLIGTAHFTVIDGDTVRLDNNQVVRLVGYNTPETFHPHCEAEHKLGERATARLKEIVSKNKPVVLMIKSGSCAYGRACGTLTVSSPAGTPVFVSELLINEGLAEPMICTKGKCPKPKDWCSGEEEK